ncbi:cache domain-containing protein [Fusibacter ferrireducens]|uniref:Cache domain-containing protein n=1 Tax=Fusibacter ferrireducens TaxID=2785058 RepID=A0ABR9ZQ36_9FIRM|nr:cache domain-containing protein [Fusibacter ferrireducens]MBF4692575.1 cache domain-containing protein [Fusibacter ferrireducens]
MTKRLNSKVLKSLIYMLITGFLFFNIYKHTYQTILQNDYTEAFDRSVQQYNLSIKDFFSNIESATEMLSKNELIQYVSDDPEKYYDSTLDLLKNFYQVYDSTAFAYFTPEKKIWGSQKLISWPDTSETLSNTSWEAQQRPWYINAIRSNPNFAWTEPYVDTTTNKHVITVSKTVIDKENEFKGVLAIDIYLDDLSEQIHALKKYNEGSVFMILKMDNQNYFIIDNLDNDISKTLFTNELIDQIYQNESDALYFENKSGHYYISYATNPITGWKAIGVIDPYKFTRATTRIIINLLVGIVTLISISIFSVLYIKKQIGSTIQTLSGSILATEDKPISQIPKMDLLKLETEGQTYEKTTSHINLLFHIEAEKENIRTHAHDLSALDLSKIKAINHSLSKLADYKNALNLSLKSHEIQVISMRHFLLELKEQINPLRQNANTLAFEAELNRLDELIKDIMPDN